MTSPSFRDMENLSAFLDGQLSPAEKRRLENRIQSDPVLAAALQEHGVALEALDTVINQDRMLFLSIARTQAATPLGKPDVDRNRENLNHSLLLVADCATYSYLVAECVSFCLFVGQCSCDFQHSEPRGTESGGSTPAS